MRKIDRVLSVLISIFLCLSVFFFMHSQFFAFPRERFFLGYFIECAIYVMAFCICFSKSSLTVIFGFILMWSLFIFLFIAEAAANHLF